MSIEHVGLPDITEQAELDLLAQVDLGLVMLMDHLPKLEGNPEAQVYIHTRLAGLAQSLNIVRDQIETMLYAELPERENRAHRIVKDRLVLDGVGVVEPNDKGAKWIDVNYAKMLTDVLRERTEAGEISGPADAAQIVTELITFSGIRSNKNQNTGLHRYGHDRSEYATYVEGTPGVRVIPASHPETPIVGHVDTPRVSSEINPPPGEGA